MSCSYVEGELDLSGLDFTISLYLRDGIFETVNFGHDFNRKFDTLDLRTTSILRVQGVVPAGIHTMLLDEETRIPESFRKYLEQFR